MKACPVKFEWKGSPDPDVTSGQAIFTYADDDRVLTLSLPNFAVAHELSNFIRVIYEGGKIDGLKQMRHALEVAANTIL